MSKIRLLLSLAFIAGLTLSISDIAFATSTIGEEKEAEYSLNNIMFFQHCPTTKNGGSEICGTNKNYAGEQVFNEKQMEAIQANQPFYEKAASQYGFPWQIIAVIHQREHGLARSNPGNGQGVYQFASATRRASCTGGNFSPGRISDEQFQIQTNCAAEAIKNSYGAGLDLNTDDGIKRMFFSYNGRASAYINQAIKLGFSQEQAENGEGSPYVMNRYDAKREPSSTWGQIKTDGGSIQYPANKDFGAFVYYKALACDGDTVNPDDSADTADDAASVEPSPQPSSTTKSSSSNISANAEKIAQTALKLAWPKGSDKSDYDKKQGGQPTEAVKQAWESLGTTSGNTKHGPDCGYFVQAVIGYSNVDPDYSNDSVGLKIESYAKKNPDKWETIDFSDGDTSKLQSGDIILGHGSSKGTGFHAWIAADIDGELWRVEASYTQKLWGRVSKKVGKKYKSYDKQLIVRAKGGSSTPSCDPFNAGSKNINATGAALAWPLDTPKAKYTLARGKVLEAALTSPGQTVDYPGTGSGNAVFQKAWVETKMSQTGLNNSTLDNTGIYSWRYGAYCCGFTAAVVRYSGYDPHFNGSLSVGGYEQVNYARKHSDLWEVIEWDHQKSSLKGGDIFNSSTHSWMVVEDASGELYISEASLHSHTFGHIDKYRGASGKVYIIRATHANNSNTGVSVKGGMQTASAAKTGSLSTTSANNHDIAASARYFAYDTRDSAAKKSIKASVKDAWKKLLTDNGVTNFSSTNMGKDCGVFVSGVLRYAGFTDRMNGPTHGKNVVIIPELGDLEGWFKVDTDGKNEKELEDGDVIYEYENGKLHHFSIFARADNGEAQIIEASHGDHYGWTGKFYKNGRQRVVWRNRNNKSGTGTVTTECNVCGGEKGSDGGDGTLQDGGFTSVEEAEKVVMTEYRGLWNNDSVARSKYLINAGCSGHLINNCPSFVRYFVNKYAKKKWTDGPTGHGKDVAGNVAKFYGLSTSKTPSAYSVFSVPEGRTICSGGIPCGHTGIVLGVDTARKKVIIGEAGCGSGLDFIHAKEKDLSTFTSGKYTFTNLNSVLKTGGLSDV